MHRCLKRHGISRLPETGGDKPARKPFKAYPIGYFHIDIAEVRTEQGKLHLFVAIDRTSKFAFAQLHERATTRIAANFLRALLQTVPYRAHTVLTDNGQHFTTPGNIASAAPLIREALERGEIFRAHSFELACAQNRIDHRLGEDAMDVHSDNAHGATSSWLVVRRRELAGDTTTTDSRSQRIRAGRRGGQITSSSSQLMSFRTACPHLRAPGAPCPGWSHHSPILVRTGRTSQHRHLHAG